MPQSERNRITIFLVIAIVSGYFGTIFLVTFAAIPDARLAQVIGLLSAIQNAFVLIVGYYFGSSSGSKAKSDTINELTGTGDGSGTTTTKSKVVEEKVTTKEVTIPAIPAWAVGTIYKAGDLVTIGTQKFIALSNHTSTTEDQPGVGVSSAEFWKETSRENTNV